MNLLCTTQSTCPWQNLALEELLFGLGEGGAILYLWQNQNTVVIGRNQNAWRECRVAKLEAEGGKLARRTSGGGAVFHDLGNLNFTFILPREAYCLPRQLGVVLSAVRSLGVDASFSGRNDIVATASGAKFSGNAFRFTQQAALHHGTILISANMAKLGRYLAPSPEKLASKGVESVRSRVVNLAELSGSVTVPAMQEALAAAFRAEYGPFSQLDPAALDAKELEALTRRHSSWEWRLGEGPRFDIELERRFSWGELQLKLSYAHGVVTHAAAYSDAMDEAAIRAIPPALTGCRFNSGELANALLKLRTPEAESAANWLLEKGF